MLTEQDDDHYSSTNMFFAGLWAIWKYRNDVLFRKEEPSPTTLIEIMQKWLAKASQTIQHRIETKARSAQRDSPHIIQAKVEIYTS